MGLTVVAITCARGLLPCSPLNFACSVAFRACPAANMTPFCQLCLVQSPNLVCPATSDVCPAANMTPFCQLCLVQSPNLVCPATSGVCPAANMTPFLPTLSCPVPESCVSSNIRRLPSCKYDAFFPNFALSNPRIACVRQHPARAQLQIPSLFRQLRLVQSLYSVCPVTSGACPAANTTLFSQCSLAQLRRACCSAKLHRACPVGVSLASTAFCGILHLHDRVVR